MLTHILTASCLLLAACTTNALPSPTDGAMTPDSGAPDLAGRTCGQLSTDVQGWIDSHKACAADSECTIAYTRCTLPYSCGTYMNTAGKGGLDSLLASFDTMKCDSGIACGACLGPLPAPACKAGVCGPKRTCADVLADVQAYFATPANVSCQVDTDCQGVVTDCGLPGVCGIALRANATSGLQALLVEWSVLACVNGQPCPDCAPRPGASCQGGKCLTP